MMRTFITAVPLRHPSRIESHRNPPLVVNQTLKSGSNKKSKKKNNLIFDGMWVNQSSVIKLPVFVERQLVPDF